MFMSLNLRPKRKIFLKPILVKARKKKISVPKNINKTSKITP